MGGKIEMNGALQISAEQGFPDQILNVEKHHKHKIGFEDVKDMIFEFRGKPGARIYQIPPSRNFLIQNIDGKWIYWGMIYVIEQTIHWDEKDCTTSGKFRLISIFEPAYQKLITQNESRAGCSYF
jgi:hypothetical protein